jgi:phospholipid transport system transporter-binding protein
MASAGVFALVDQSVDASSAATVLSLDAGTLQHFDSSVLALLLQLRRQAQARGVRVDVRDLPPRLVALARLYGVADLLS